MSVKNSSLFDVKIKKFIQIAFSAVFLLTPLIVFPKTSEIFEFNKIVFIYAFATIISTAWILRMVVNNKIIFQKTLLDIPLLIFLLTQLISLLFSIDKRISLLGYYSRFNGGVFSLVSFLSLYWAYVSNINKETNSKIIKFGIYSVIPVSVYAVLQHFGIDKNIWVQDVQNRVFSTLGQPNWLAAFITLLIPLVWFFFLKKDLEIKTRKIWLALFAIMFLALTFTKSRSGILGFLVSLAVFTFLTLQSNGKNIKNITKKLYPILAIVISVAIFFGTAFTSGIEKLLTKKSNDTTSQQIVDEDTSIQTGGTESGEIRKIVWEGAFKMWLNNSIFGTGVETFALSYYRYRPARHNLVSEWNFVYNKAHNEYLNYLATTGIVGFLGYMLVVTASIGQIAGISLPISKNKIFESVKKLKPFQIALISGYSALLVTNFFGFSVVATSLLFFLFPAFAFLTNHEQKDLKEKNYELDSIQKMIGAIVLIFSCYILFSIGKYWRADTLYNKGRILNTKDTLQEARPYLEKAVFLSPKEAIFWNELSQNSTDISIFYSESYDKENAEKFAQEAINESDMAVKLSPNSVNILRARSVIFIKLSITNQEYLETAKQVLEKAVTLAPTDARLRYNLGLAEARLGNLESARDILLETVKLKSNYVSGRFALGLIYEDLNQKDLALQEFNYILENLDPNNALVKNELENIK